MRPYTQLSILGITLLLSWAVPSAAQAPASDPNNTGNWKLNPAFSDEFNGTSVDTAKWVLSPGVDNWNGRLPGYYLASNATVSGGNLQLTLRRDVNNTTIPASAQLMGYKGYTTGQVHTAANAPYGYYEVRMKVMDSSVDNAFWLYGVQGEYRTEIDITEISSQLHGGTGPANAAFTGAHLWAYPGHPVTGTEYPSGIEPYTFWTAPWSAAADYHVYGIDWNADTISWYVDGVQRRQSKNTYFVVPMQIVLDNETTIYENWFGTPLDSELPGTTYVDYLRAWTKSDNQNPTPTATTTATPKPTTTPVPTVTATPGPTGTATPKPSVTPTVKPTPTTPPTTQVPASDPNNTGNWTLNPAFSDEFNADSLDTSKWIVKGIGWDGRQPSYFLPQNVAVGGGNLQLTLRRDASNATIPPAAQQQGYYGYTAAEVNTIAGAQYGYYEARIKAMSSSGATNFWLYGDQGDYRTGLDVAESAGKVSGGTAPADTIFMGAHLWRAPGMPLTGEDYASKVGVDPSVPWSGGWNAAADYHTYGIDWNADTITWYIDGVQRRQIKNGYWSIQMPLIFDTEVSISSLGVPADGDLPSTLLVDYVRAWTKSDKPNPTPTATAAPTAAPRLQVTLKLSQVGGHSVIACIVKDRGAAVPSQKVSVQKATARSGPYKVWMSKKTNAKGQALFPYAQPRATWYVRCLAAGNVSLPKMIKGSAPAANAKP
jgi:beta-glucanase (GH16 family)